MKKINFANWNVNELNDFELQETNGGTIMMCIMIAVFCFLLGVGISTGGGGNNTEAEQ